MTGYIYLLQNKINGKCYVGQTIDVNRRLAEHIYEANRGSNFKIHQAIRKYGADLFEFSVLETVNGDESEVLSMLNDLEVDYIEHYDSFRNGYNMTLGSRGSLGLHHTEETKRKLSEIKAGTHISESHKQAIANSNRVRKVSENTRHKMSQNNPLHNAEHSAKISEAYKKQSPEQIAERCRKAWETRRKKGDVSAQQRTAAIKGHETRKRKLEQQEK